MSPCKQLCKGCSKTGFPSSWGLEKVTDRPQQGEPRCSRRPAPLTPPSFTLQCYKLLSFLPDKLQACFTDWSQFWKGRDISDFADLGLVGLSWALAGLQPARWSVRVCECVCPAAGGVPRFPRPPALRHGPSEQDARRSASGRGGVSQAQGAQGIWAFLSCRRGAPSSPGPGAHNGWRRREQEPQQTPGARRPCKRLAPLRPTDGDFVSDWSPMHEAAIHGRPLSLRNLISQGCSVNLVTADHVSPLHEACLGGHPSCADILLKHGAQVNGVTTEWHTPLFNACVSGSQECVDLLLQHGANTHPESDRASPIHEAAKRGHVECVESLAAHGDDINHHIRHLGTPLYLACENQQIACARKLLESGASVNQGKGLESPLHAAAKMCSGELACLLMDFGADTQAKNAEGKCPVELVPAESPLIQLFLQRSGPPSLMQLCRLRIRKCFGIKQHHKITGLTLPEELKRFLLHS